MSEIGIDERELTAHLRQLWEEARTSDQMGVSVEEVFDRLERKYQPMVEAIERQQGKPAAERVRARLVEMKRFTLTVQHIKGQNSQADPELIQQDIENAVREVPYGKSVKPEGQEGSNT